MTHEAFTCNSKGYSGEGTIDTTSTGEVFTISMMHHGASNVVKVGDLLEFPPKGNIRRQRRITGHLTGQGNIGSYRIAYVQTA